jgi:LmbE family N-acetylglucosaminyl deacetylase
MTETLTPIPEDWDRAVAIAAHPDDLEYGAAAAFARWTDQGREVSYVMVTSGEAGIDGLAPDTAKRVREEEERRAARVVGVTHVEFLGHADGAVEYGLALRRDLATAIRRLRPDVLVTMNFELTWGDGSIVNHADHRAVGLAALDAVRDAANRWMFADLGEPWQRLKAVYLLGMSPSTHYVDVGGTFERGVASLREHRAYLEGLGGTMDPDAFLRGFARSTGEAVGCDLAVAFRRFNV